MMSWECSGSRGRQHADIITVFTTNMSLFCSFMRSNIKYLELDLKKSLQENLMHKTIVEYPEVFVVLKQHSQEFLARIPERPSAARCVASASVSSGPCSPAEPRSPAPVHVAKRPKVVPEDDELEDGELRSDEEDGSAEDDDGGETENKVPVTHHDEEELQNGVLDAGANQSEGLSVNIASRAEEMMVVSGGQDSAETLIDGGSSLGEGNTQNAPGLPEEEKSGDSGAKLDKEGTIDAQHDFSQSCIGKSQSDQCDASEIEGRSSVSREKPNPSSSESHICADVTLA